jgi:hypothetical protein
MQIVYRIEIANDKVVQGLNFSFIFIMMMYLIYFNEVFSF